MIMIFTYSHSVILLMLLSYTWCSSNDDSQMYDRWNCVGVWYSLFGIQYKNSYTYKIRCGEVCWWGKSNGEITISHSLRFQIRHIILTIWLVHIDFIQKSLVLGVEGGSDTNWWKPSVCLRGSHTTWKIANWGPRTIGLTAYSYTL